LKSLLHSERLSGKCGNGKEFGGCRGSGGILTTSWGDVREKSGKTVYYNFAFGAYQCFKSGIVVGIIRHGACRIMMMMMMIVVA